MVTASLFVAIVGGMTAGPVPEPSISRIEVAPRVLDARSDQDVRIRFHLSAPESVVIDIFDEKWKQVWTKRALFPRGYGEFRWDGRTGDDRQASGGVYTLALTTASKGIKHQDADSQGTRVAVYDVSLNHATGQLSYRLPEPAHVQVRFGLGDGGPLLRTIDTLQGPGSQVVQWDGWDESRVVNLLGSKNVLASVLATSLPEYAIIVRDDMSPTPPPPISFEIRFLQKTVVGSDLRRRLLHAEVRAIGDVESLFRGGRLEWIFFVDNRFVFEEERTATNPYVLELDVTPLSKGEHVLTVNLAEQTSDFVRSFSGRFVVDR